MAFGALTHINTIGKVDELRRDDYYVFSAGSSGKHSERNIGEKDLHVIYVWVPPASCWRRHPTGGHASTPAPAPTVSPAWSAMRRARCRSARPSRSPPC
ncbi:MAG: hypothetical protein HYX38_08280 [Rhodospirillales bacterium]|nr:hypothetical protein [Rhodospirillales bacterium]